MAYSLSFTLLTWTCKFHLHFSWQHASQMWEQLPVRFHKLYLYSHFIRRLKFIYSDYLAYHAAVTGYFYIFGSGLIGEFLFKPYIEDIFLSSMYAILSLSKIIMPITLRLLGFFSCKLMFLHSNDLCGNFLFVHFKEAGLHFWSFSHHFLCIALCTSFHNLHCW